MATVGLTIEPTAVYDEDFIIKWFNVGMDDVHHEIDEGRLKCRTIAGRRFFRGAWILEWLGMDEEWDWRERLSGSKL